MLGTRAASASVAVCALISVFTLLVLAPAASVAQPPVGTGGLPVWSTEGDQISALFGSSVAFAGDVNGDGIGDVLVGAPMYDGGEADEGRAFLYFGSPLGPSATPDWMAESDQAGAFFGSRVAGIGDVNDDGFDDIAVSASFYDATLANEGRVYIYHGSLTGPSLVADLVLDGGQANAWYGTGLDGAGDVNNDGFDDLVVGAIRYSNGESNEGRAYLYLGSGSGLSSTAAWISESDQAFARYGNSTSGAGDVNGDGFDDVVVGAPLYTMDQTSEGRSYLYLGSAGGLATVPAWVVDGDQGGANSGWVATGVGDVNGDGFDDVAVGAPFVDDPETDEGRASLYLGSALGLSTTPAWTGGSNQDLARYGTSLAGAGDVNGDGRDDLMIGAPGFDNGENEEGRVFFHLGTPGGVTLNPVQTLEGNQVDARYGGAVAGAGDVDGDGVSDVMVGASNFDMGQVDEGKVWVYWGMDVTAPTVTCPSTIVLECTGPTGAVATFSATGSDVIDPAPSVSCAPVSGSLFPIGTTSVSCTATDASGNSSTCQFDVIVQDTTGPTLNLPADINRTCVLPAGEVVNFAVTASDLCDAAPGVVANPPSGSVFTPGVTTVNVTATDASGNMTMGSFDVIMVGDTAGPSVSCPSDMTVECTGPAGAVVSFSVTATDDCDPLPTVGSTPSSGSQFALGTTTVTGQAMDASGNVSNCTFDVTVEDTVAPSISVPSTISVACTGNLSAPVTFSVTATDLCDTNPTVTATPPSGSQFPLGQTTVMVTAMDASGNSSNDSFNVIVDDGDAPSIQCPATVTEVATGPGGAMVSFSITASDTCDPAPAVSSVPASGSLFPVGTTVVMATATDAAGNMAMCQFDVVVLQDFVTCRAGNINGGAGPITDVIFANDDAGMDPDRVIGVPADTPVVIRWDNPPSKPVGTSNHATYIWAGESTFGTPRSLPFSLGISCMPMPLGGGGVPTPFRILHTLGSSRYPMLGVPTDAVNKAPTTFDFTTGVPMGARITVQGLMVDDDAPNGIAGVTNALVIEGQ